MANPIIFKKGIYCSTAYSYDIGALSFIDANFALPDNILDTINGTTLTTTQGLVDRYTLRTLDATLYNTYKEFSAGNQIHITYDVLNDIMTNNPGIDFINLLCVPFVNGTQRRYFIVSLLNIHSIENGWEFVLWYGWTNSTDITDSSTTVYWQSDLGNYFSRNNYREDYFLDCRMIHNNVFKYIYPLEFTNNDVGLVITFSGTTPFYNPQGQAPFNVRWNIDGTGQYDFYNGVSVNRFASSRILTLGGAKLAGYGETEEVDGSDQAGEPSEEGGYYDGSFDDSSDPILIPTVPPVGVTNIGMVNVYRVPDGGLRRFGLELFPEFSFTPPAGTGDALADLYEVIKDFVSDTADMLSNTQANTLINYVIDCHVIPVTPTYTTSEYVKVGGREMRSVAANPVTQDYVDFSCGELNIREYYSNFADYLTNAKLYLPFVGFVPVRAEWFQNSHLKVDYRFNVIDGSFVAFVRGYGEKVNNNNDSATVLAQYTGNACVHIPITGANYAQMVSGIIGAAGGIAAGAATGNFIGAAGSALSLIGLHGDIAQSNAYSSSPAFMGVRVPFLLIERPVSNFATNYPHEHGIPSNITTAIGSCTGFVTAKDIHLDGIPCTDEERRLIEAAFNTGVIV